MNLFSKPSTRAFAHRANSARGLGCVLSIAALTAYAAPALASANHFNFTGLQFMPEADQASTAQTFFDQAISPGTPMAAAVKIVDKTQAYCHRPSAADSKVRCTFVSIVGDPYHDGRDMLWTVTLTPATDGTVADVNVTKDVHGV